MDYITLLIKSGKNVMYWLDTLYIFLQVRQPPSICLVIMLHFGGLQCLTGRNGKKKGGQ